MKTSIARWWTEKENGSVQCQLCPRSCTIAPGNAGYCGVRCNQDGVLVSTAYGLPAALQVDPIEKKPLRHYLPGTRTFSVGTFGCNLGCIFCQNDHLSRGNFSSVRRDWKFYEPEKLVRLAVQHNCRSIAFTYNEPAVWAEYAVETFRLARKSGIGTVLVTNGFISPAAAEDLYPLTDAAKIDVKGFSEAFYQEMCNGSLAPVLAACEYFYRDLQKHLEITNLVIPGKNSSPEMIEALFDWAESRLSRDVPIHFSAYFPAYKYNGSPRTPREMLFDIRSRAVERGFTRVYLGNI